MRDTDELDRVDLLPAPSGLEFLEMSEVPEPARRERDLPASRLGDGFWEERIGLIG
jgi:hypothetical protein